MTHHHNDAPSNDGHRHSHGGHVHAPASFGTAFAIGIGLNTAFVLAEVGFGWRAIPSRSCRTLAII